MKHLKSFIFLLEVLGCLNGYQAQEYFLDTIGKYELNAALFEECEPALQNSGYDHCIKFGTVQETDVESYCMNARLQVHCFDKKSYVCKEKQKEEKIRKIIVFLTNVSTDTIDALCKEKTLIEDNLADQDWRGNCFEGFARFVASNCMYDYIIEGGQTCSAMEKHKACIKRSADNNMKSTCQDKEKKIEPKHKDKFLKVLESGMKEHYPKNCPKNSALKISPAICFTFIFFFIRLMNF